MVFAFRGQSILKLPHRKPVYGLSVNPQNDCILATAGDDGRVLIFDLRDSSDAGDATSSHSWWIKP